MNKSKKIILTVICCLFAALVGCTFLATSIANTLIAKADVVMIKEGVISQSVNVDAKRSRTNILPIYAQANGVISEDVVFERESVEKGDPIYKFDSSEADITAKQALLAVSNIEHQIEQGKLIDTQIEQQKLNLKTAENELAALSNKQTLDTQQSKLLSQIESLQNDISTTQLNDYTSHRQLSMQLSLAWQQLNEYDSSASAETAEQISKLIKSITDLEIAISSGTLSQEQLNIANNELNAARLALEKLYQGGGNDAERNRLIMQIDELNDKIRLSEQQSATNTKELASQLAIAQREMELFEKNSPINQQSELNKATSAIIQAKEQLDTAKLQKSSLKALQLQLDIAKEQLALHKKRFPQGGVYTAPFNGTVYRKYKDVGESVTSGELIMEIYTSESKSSIEYRLPNEIGGEYSMGSRVDVVYRVFRPDPETKIIESVMKQLTAEVTYIRFDEETDEYVFHATYDGNEEIPKETIIDATMNKVVTNHEMTVPVSSIFLNKDKESCVYVVETRDSLFKQEQYVRMVPVRVVDSNGIICALSATGLKPGEKIVQYLSKSVNDGDRVNVQN